MQAKWEEGRIRVFNPSQLNTLLVYGPFRGNPDHLAAQAAVFVSARCRMCSCLHRKPTMRKKAFRAGRESQGLRRSARKLCIHKLALRPLSSTLLTSNQENTHKAFLLIFLRDAFVRTYGASLFLTQKLIRYIR
jgi:hypothetical protein